MTLEQFEEWAKRMQERHEALAQSLEILTQDVHGMQTSLGDLKAIAEASLRNINALAGIAENHERRITRLEGGSE